jgi:hypothetical protein
MHLVTGMDFEMSTKDFFTFSNRNLSFRSRPMYTVKCCNSSTCPTVTESRFFTFSLRYLNTFKSDKGEYFQKVYKLDCPTHHKSFIRSRPSFTVLQLKYRSVTESPKMVIGFECCVKN